MEEKKALEYHENFPSGKLSIVPSKPLKDQKDLSLAYTPGVAIPCKLINKTPDLAYNYTNKGNLVAIISNGTAVLGLGDIGPLASKPVMEGKSVLFKCFSGIDSIDIEVDEKSPKRIIDTVKAISPTFGGINLEDIKAPECFEIEETLVNSLDIPIMHDDQHGTAIVVLAGLINALELVKKDFKDIKIVINGAGAAAIACSKLLLSMNVDKANIFMFDSKGLINKNRSDLNKYKAIFANETENQSLEVTLKGADVFLGFSVANILKKEDIQNMNNNPIVFALANPDPEISYDIAKKTRNDIIIATGRSDYPNQINNVLGFPYIFRAALDTKSKSINNEMKIACAKAIASLTKEEVSKDIKEAFNLSEISFGKDYIIPKALDSRLLKHVSIAVAKEAIKSGVARKKITDWNEYENFLDRIKFKS